MALSIREVWGPLEMNYSEYLTIVNEMLVRKELSTCLDSL